MSIGGNGVASVRSIKTTQSASGSAGGWPIESLAPPEILRRRPDKLASARIKPSLLAFALQVRQVERAS